MDTRIIFGPPGTGKTTYLLRVLEEEFKKVHPSRIAFVSFTRKGTYEGASRAEDKFGLKRDDLKFFRTIHSLCFSALHMRKDRMLDKDSYRQFSDAMGMKFLGYYTEELRCNNDMFLFADTLLRNNVEAGSLFMQDVNIKQYAWVRDNFAKFKRTLGKLDFTDLLEQYLIHGRALPVEVAIIDEAQDLTTLQWQVVQRMFSRAKRVYIAGDDDQAIYEWSGADVGHFLRLKGERLVLNKSYRLPKQIWAYADQISRTIANRQAKLFEPNESEGAIIRCANNASIDIVNDEDTLILCRNNSHLYNIAKLLKEQGKVFYIKGELSVDSRIVDAIKQYERWRKGEIDDNKISLYSRFFVAFDKSVPWYSVLDAEHTTIDYYRALAANKARFDSPKIRLETIHSSKGSEADHVILALDVTKRVHDNILKNNDSEMRCYYVGVTRARKRLTLKLSESQYGYTPLGLPGGHSFGRT